MRSRREALGISQGRLGRELSLTFSQIQKYEKGTNRIGAGRLYQIATFLRVPLSYFFEGLDGFVPEPEDSAARSIENELVTAFRAIVAEDTRSSVLALIRSLGPGRAGDPVSG